MDLAPAAMVPVIVAAAVMVSASQIPWILALRETGACTAPSLAPLQRLPVGDPAPTALIVAVAAQAHSVVEVQPQLRGVAAAVTAAAWGTGAAAAGP